MNTKLFVLAVLCVLLSTAVVAFISPIPPKNITAQGGNITRLNITWLGHTRHWQGIPGQVFFSTASTTPGVNATGSFINETDINLTTDCNNPTSASGFIVFSNLSTVPTGLVAGNLALLDQLTGNRSDSGGKTFTSTSTFALPSGTITGVPTTFSYINSTPQSSSFREGYFNDASGSLVFITVIEVDLQGFNESFFDYQVMLLAENKSTRRYYIFADITFTCPAVGVPGGGAGGKAGACLVTWNCSAWGPCQLNGLQHRTCVQRTCQNFTAKLKPPTVRHCTPSTPREERTELVSERDILWPGFLGNLTLNLSPEHGYVLEPGVMHGWFKNLNKLSLEDVSYAVTTPEVWTAFAPAHTAPMLLWNTPLGGWTDHGNAESRALDWEVIPPDSLERLNPISVESLHFSVIPPVMQPKVVDIGLSAYSGEVRVKSTSAPFIVDVHPFQIDGEWRQDQGVLVLYFVVDNRGRKEKTINIEVDINHGKSTLIGELLGPLRVPADSVAIYGHEYRLSHAARNKEIVINAHLFAPEMNLRATTQLETR